MGKINLFWAVVWSVVLALCIGGIWWRPANYIAAGIAAIIAAMFWHDYRKTKGM